MAMLFFVQSARAGGDGAVAKAAAVMLYFALNSFKGARWADEH